MRLRALLNPGWVAALLALLLVGSVVFNAVAVWQQLRATRTITQQHANQTDSLIERVEALLNERQVVVLQRGRDTIVIQPQPTATATETVRPEPEPTTTITETPEPPPGNPPVCVGPLCVRPTEGRRCMTTFEKLVATVHAE